jgi:predicted nucleic acid-binding protein
MITAIDTNVLLDILVPNPHFYSRSVQALESCAQAGSLTICDLVYSELCVQFQRQAECELFMKETDIRVEHLSHQASFLASRMWREYLAAGEKKTRIISDFLVGAHAQLQASRLLTRDRGFYAQVFRSLVLVDPRASGGIR